VEDRNVYHKKNIRDFCGKPIISYILDAAKESQLFDKIHVSTDSPEILKVIENLGYETDFMRQQELADNYTLIMPVLKFVIEQFRKTGKAFDEVWLLMPCAPQISAHDLCNAVELQLRKSGALQCIVEYPVPIE
jgi:pseudaminic acid cytidylyltransferase